MGWSRMRKTCASISLSTKFLLSSIQQRQDIKMMERWITTLLLSLVSVTIALAATSTSSFTLSDAKFSIQSIDGTARISQQFGASSPPTFPSALSLQADDILRLSFSVSSSSKASPPPPPPPVASAETDETDPDAATSSSSTKPAPSSKSSISVPHQVFVVLVDENEADRQQTYVLPVKPSSGKASWSLRTDRLPQLLQSSSGSLKLSLLLGSFQNPTGLSLPIATLTLPSSVLKLNTPSNPQRAALEEQYAFKPHQERRHTFSIPPSESMPESWISSAAALITIAGPWVVFLGLVLPLLSSLSPKAPSLFSSLLLLCLLLLEALAVRFWIGGTFTLLKLLPYLTVAGTLTLLVGRGALREMGGLREKGEKLRVGKDQKTE